MKVPGLRLSAEDSRQRDLQVLNSQESRATASIISETAGVCTSALSSRTVHVIILLQALALNTLLQLSRDHCAVGSCLFLTQVLYTYT